MLGRQLGLAAVRSGVDHGASRLAAWRRRWRERSLLRGMVASILVSVTILGIQMPSIPQLFPSVALARVLRQANCTDPVAATVGYHEPSRVFLAGTKTHWPRASRPPTSRGGGCRFAFIEAAGAQLPAPRRRHRPALHPRGHDRRRQHLDRQDGLDHGLPRRADAMTDLRTAMRALLGAPRRPCATPPPASCCSGPSLRCAPCSPPWCWSILHTSQTCATAAGRRLRSSMPSLILGWAAGSCGQPESVLALALLDRVSLTPRMTRGVASAIAVRAG